MCLFRQKLLELNSSIVCDLVADNSVCHLAPQVRESPVAARSECDVARPVSGRNLDGRQRSGLERLGIKRIEVELIGAQVRNDQKFSGWVEDSLVRMRAFLAVRVRTFAGKGDSLDILQLG